MAAVFRFRRKSKKSNIPRSARTPGRGQKAATFQYSSNRQGTERVFDRGATDGPASTQKLKGQLMRIPYGIGLICLLLGIFYLSTLSINPQIIISGDQQLIREKGVYQKATQQLMKFKLQYRSKISFDGQELASQLQNSFPELERVNVSTPLLRHRPVLELAVSPPALVFVSGNNMYLLDERGITLFDLHQTNHKVDIAKLPVLTDKTSFAVEVNKPALSSSQISFIDEVMRQVNAKNLEVTLMELTGGGGELDIRFKNLPYRVKFNFYEDSRRSAGAFLAAKEQTERDGTKPAEYIDVRIPTRAYIK